MACLGTPRHRGFRLALRITQFGEVSTVHVSADQMCLRGLHLEKGHATCSVFEVLPEEVQLSCEFEKLGISIVIS